MKTMPPAKRVLTLTVRPEWEGRTVKSLLRSELHMTDGLIARVKLRERGYSVSNVDCTVIAQRPKLAPHIPAMRQRLAAAMGLETDRVSVKATTEEGLGFSGEGLGIAAHAVALIGKTE